jgi:hypothetical protein
MKHNPTTYLKKRFTITIKSLIGFASPFVHSFGGLSLKVIYK